MFFSVSNSTIFDTPELYARLKNGHFKSTGRYEIRATAHPNLFADVKSFAAANLLPDSTGIIFADENRNLISLYPLERSVNAIFTQGDVDENRLSYLPTDLDKYDVTLNNFVSADIDAIKQWPKTAEITFLFNDELNAEDKSIAEEMLKFHDVSILIYEYI